MYFPKNITKEAVFLVVVIINKKTNLECPRVALYLLQNITCWTWRGQFSTFWVIHQEFWSTFVYLLWTEHQLLSTYKELTELPVKKCHNFYYTIRCSTICSIFLKTSYDSITLNWTREFVAYNRILLLYTCFQFCRDWKFLTLTHLNVICLAKFEYRLSFNVFPISRTSF